MHDDAVRQPGDDGATMVDLAFALDGSVLPGDYRQALAAAVQQVLPWLADASGAGIHRLNLIQGGDGQALLARRTRLVLRLPRKRCDDARALQGQTLDIAGHALRAGRLQARELLPWGTLYAYLVATAVDEEADFVREVEDELRTLGVPCRLICGRRQAIEAGALKGYSLMLDGLSAPASLRLLQHGIGPHRRLGCGLFVPHKSAAAVGTRE